ncbi:MAG: type 4 pilus major pilin, partial [Alphaproteobacteria bacterium]|nr:type 4 pilus major pilin [Alphaproteobacteria bacterium]
LSFTNPTTSLFNLFVIPAKYVNPTTGTTVLNPWGGAFTVSLPSSTSFRLTFSGLPTVAVCENLLMSGTVCEATQSGCPRSVGTATATQSPTTSSVAGWQVMTLDRANQMCRDAGYSTVYFNYSIY